MSSRLRPVRTFVLRGTPLVGYFDAIQRIRTGGLGGTGII
jgi:hypothetical protein